MATRSSEEPTFPSRASSSSEEGKTDLDLVHEARGGDPEAFGELIDRYERPIFNLAFRITGTREDAMDATQTAFTNAFENLDRFDSRYRFFSWLYRIAVNASLDLVKGRREVDLGAPPVDPRRSPEDLYQAEEIGERVQLALMRLTPEHRSVIVLRHYLGLSYAEIAEATDVPIKRVRSRLFEARKRLETLLLESGAER